MPIKTENINYYVFINIMVLDKCELDPLSFFMFKINYDVFSSEFYLNIIILTLLPLLPLLAIIIFY